MSKLLPLLAAMPLAACTTPMAPTLAQLGDARVQVVTIPEPGVTNDSFPQMTTVFIRGTNGDCTVVGSDVTADIDGVALNNVYNDRGALETVDSPDCNLARFEVVTPPATQGTSTVHIRDAGTTWTITGDDLFANDFALVGTPVEGGHAHIAWRDGGTIDAGASAQFWGLPGDGAITLDVGTRDSELDVRLPRGVSGEGKLGIDAGRTLLPTRCDGPGSCGITLVGNAMIPVTITPVAVAPRGADAVRD